MTEKPDTVAAERDQLRRENEALQRQLDDARAQLASTGTTAQTAAGRGVPHRPSFELSEGERADLEQRGTTTSPWTGETLVADDHGITPASDDAKAAQERARERRDQATTTTTADTAQAPRGRPVRDNPRA